MRTRYVLDKQLQAIYDGDKVISRSRRQQPTSLEELERMLLQEEAQDIFICSYQTSAVAQLERTPLQEVTSTWDTAYKHHICLSDEADLTEFPNGYCYFVELWEGDAGGIIVVLYYCH